MKSETYGEWQRRLRLERGWTQLALSLKTGIGQSELSKYELGRMVPGPGKMQKIGLAFGITPPLLELAGLNGWFEQTELDVPFWDLAGVG